MRNDERLRTIYEVMAPYIVRSERNWRDYLAFASRFHKQSFDNILLVYAQDEDVTILATKKQWAGVGRNLISRPKGIAVCVYSNARLTLDYLFDISQTMGKEIHPTNWQLSDEMQKALGERLTFSHGFQAQPFPDLLYALAREAVNDNYEHYLQGLRQETKNHLFEEIPAGGFEAQYIQLLSDSVSYFIGKKCHLPDEAIRMGDGMATVSHFNTVPLVAHLGMAVTSISKAVLLEMERNIRIINRERKVQYEQTEHQFELQRTGRGDSPRPANLQQQRSGQAPGSVRADGAGISQRQPAGAIYDFENGWQSDGGHAPGTGRGHGEDRGPDPADASAGAGAADRGYSGAHPAPERPEADGGGNGTPDHRADPPLTEEQPHTEAPQGAKHEGEPPAQDGSFSPSEKAEHRFSDEEVRRHYEHILTSTDLYPAELHQAVRAVLADGVTDYNWTEKGREICGLFTAYGDREFQGEVLYRTKLRGEDGISFYFDDGYTYFPWPSLANLLDALIEMGVYEELAANNGVVVTDSEDHLLSMFYGYTPAVGDVLTFESMDGKTIEVTVMGIAKPSVTSGTGAWGLFTLTEELADQLYPDIENREAVWNVHTSEDSDALRASIFSLLENPVLTVFSRADHAASLESQLKMMTRGVYLLLAFLFVFSMVNLVNTLMTNLLARQQELGILQSVGMTGKQVSRMLIAECLWYAGVTVFLSVGIGGILGWIFDYVISSFNIFGELSYQFPLMETVVFVLALLVVTGIFSVVAVRYSKRLSLVERIKTMD